MKQKSAEAVVVDGVTTIQGGRRKPVYRAKGQTEGELSRRKQGNEGSRHLKGRIGRGAKLKARGSGQGEAVTRATGERNDSTRRGKFVGADLQQDEHDAALERVEANEGAAGVDGMTAEELREHLRAHWPSIRAKLDAREYQPSPVRRVTIPKPDGGETTAGDTDGAGPTDPTSDAPGTERRIRAEVQ